MVEKKYLKLGVAAVSAVALVIGLSVGLTRHKNKSEASSSSTAAASAYNNAYADIDYSPASSLGSGSTGSTKSSKSSSYSGSSGSKSGKSTKSSKSREKPRTFCEGLPDDRSVAICELISTVVDPPSLLDDPTTPEAQALNWVTNVDAISPPLDPNDTSAGCALGANAIVQRFTLANLYFATDGDNWDSNTGWLGSGEACTWIGVGGCDATSCVIVLYLEFNILVGTLPSSISNLDKLGELTGHYLIILRLQWLIVTFPAFVHSLSLFPLNSNSGARS